jgi:hypothetical protein
MLIPNNNRQLNEQLLKQHEVLVSYWVPLLPLLCTLFVRLVGVISIALGAVVSPQNGTRPEDDVSNARIHLYYQMK